MKKILHLIITACSFSFLFSFGNECKERFRIFYKGSVVADFPTDNIDSVSNVTSKLIRIYDKQKNLLVSRTLATIDSIIVETPAMEANILDLSMEGYSLSNKGNKNVTITETKENNMIIVPEENLIHFNHNPLSTIVGGYGKIDYSNSPTTINLFKKAFTLECAICSDLTDNKEKYIIGSSDDGGFSLYVTKDNELAWKICSTSDNNKNTWNTCNSNINIKAGDTYHVLCVYESSDSTASIFVNGKLSGSTKLNSSITIPATENLQWLAIGGKPSDCESLYYPWKGNIGNIKIYGQAPSEEQALDLFEKASQESRNQDNFFCIENTQTPSLYSQDKKYEIYGSGWLEGDSIHLKSTIGNTLSFCLPCTTSKTKSTIQLPEYFTPGEYVICIKRDKATYHLGQAELYPQNDGHFHQNHRQALTMHNIVLPQGFSSLTAQGFDFDNNGTPYISYETSIGMRITRWDQARINGSMAADMKLPYSGHGDSFCMEYLNGENYVWTSASLGDDGTYSGGKANAADTRLICRFKYLPGGTAYAEDGTCYYINNNGARCISIDREHDVMAIWTMENSKDVMKVYKLSEAETAELIELDVDREARHADIVKAHNLNTITPLGNFTFNRHGQAIQGFCVYDDKIYINQGVKDDIYALMSIFDYKGNVLQDRTPIGFSADKLKVQELNLSADGTFEPEGIQIHNGTMYMMFIGDYPADSGNKKHSCILKLQ